MQLIGMLDSPYVRRVAVSLKVLGVAFDLDQVSVFRHFDKFASINPVVKAPTFITDDGVVLMDSNLILEHIAEIAPRRLMPPDRAGHERALRQIGLALAQRRNSISPGWTGSAASCSRPIARWRKKSGPTGSPARS
jgi:glutathione S-transferase